MQYIQDNTCIKSWGCIAALNSVSAKICFWTIRFSRMWALTQQRRWIFRTTGSFWGISFGLLTPLWVSYFAFGSYFMGMIFHFLKDWYRFFGYDISAIQACKTGNKKWQKQHRVMTFPALAMQRFWHFLDTWRNTRVQWYTYVLT